MSIRQCARTMRHTVLIAAMFAAATSTSLAAAEKRQFEVAAGSAVQALNEFSRQANIQLLFDSDAVRGLRTRGVSGQLEVADALAQLLGGTSLVYEFVNERTVVVMLEGAAPPKSQRTSGWRANEYTRLAQAEEGSPQSSSSAVSAATLESLERQRIELEEVIVTGTNIRGVYPSSSPVEIYTAEDIARTGATTTEQFMQKLPQNFGTRTQFATAAVGIDAENRSAVTGVDLRGLGVGTSLVLLNGRRLAAGDRGQSVDVSLIPASAIARVEVLTDGASAIYGSDAIGGVVNFVLRGDFDGAETRLSYGGVTSGDLRQVDVSQTFGHAWDGGHGLVSYNFFSASGLEVTDRDYAVTAERGLLTPEEKRHNLLATFSQDLGERLQVSGDLAYANRDTDTTYSSVVLANPLNHALVTTRSETEQYFANMALDYEMSDTLTASFAATYSDIDVGGESVTERYKRTPPTVVVRPVVQEHTLLDLTASLEGALFTLPAGTVRFSLGAGVLDEEYFGQSLVLEPTLGTLGRRTGYAYAETLIPLVGAGQNVPLVRRLELSLAARYTEYSDDSQPKLNREFGNDIDPKIGLLWAPFEALNLRGTYGTSFRAPSLIQIDETVASNNLFNNFSIPYPNGPIANVIDITNYAVPNLGPETAETYTLGFDFRPASVPGLRLGGTYYNISYTDRIALPPTGGTAYVETPALFPDVTFRPPSVDYIENILRATINRTNQIGVDLADPRAAAVQLFGSPNVWITDRRTRNLALSDQDGFDVFLSYEFAVKASTVRMGAMLTRILSYKQRASAESAVVSVVNTVGQPADLRARAFWGLSRGGFDGTVNVSYVDDYTNPFVAGGARPVESWTTADLNLSYNFAGTAGMLEGVRLSLSVQNLFDRDPPNVTVRTGDTGNRCSRT